jgi:TRAP-type uncharacterized transport system fused permease subunit
MIARARPAGAPRPVGFFDLTGRRNWKYYYAVLSDLTPPDAVTAFAAANIAGSDMMATGMEAFKLGVAGFLVPFAFVYHGELLMQGTWPAILAMSAFAALSAVALAGAVVGHGLRPLGKLGRAGMLVAAALMVAKALLIQVLGLALFLAILGAGALGRGALAARAVSDSESR